MVENCSVRSFGLELEGEGSAGAMFGRNMGLGFRRSHSGLGFCVRVGALGQNWVHDQPLNLCRRLLQALLMPFFSAELQCRCLLQNCGKEGRWAQC